MKTDNAKYTIGVDFGTLSARALLVRVSDGAEIASASYVYPHAVINGQLPPPNESVKLPPEYALQDPNDYTAAIKSTVSDLLTSGGVSPDSIIGIGIDFTTCTLIPVNDRYEPLSNDPRFSSNPHAYVKLWKHHGAERYAKMITETAAMRNEPWLGYFGGKVSSEWMLPKIWETLDLAPEIYENAFRFIDAGDYIVYLLTGCLTRNSCIAGYKMQHTDDGYPSPDFLSALDPRLRDLISDKLCGDIIPVGSRAGVINEHGASLTGLKPGTAVSAAVSDAHVAAPALKITSPGQMFIIMGTSGCHMLVSDKLEKVPGICGVVRDGVIPGYYGYEAGQTCFGDHFAWFAENLAPAEYMDEAELRGISVSALLSEKAAAMHPGESGIIALDWWNGNRSILTDFDLAGLFIGMTLHTTAEELFRALIEAVAFGTRTIIENFINHGIPVNECFAAGGIAVKNPFLMQTFADVLGIPIGLTGSAETPCLGSAIFASTAAGQAAGGYDSLDEAAHNMGKLSDTVYYPAEENKRVYDLLYHEYLLLHDYFGRGGNDVMKRLIKIKSEVTPGN